MTPAVAVFPILSDGLSLSLFHWPNDVDELGSRVGSDGLLSPSLVSCTAVKGNGCSITRSHFRPFARSAGPNVPFVHLNPKTVKLHALLMLPPERQSFHSPLSSSVTTCVHTHAGCSFDPLLQQEIDDPHNGKQSFAVVSGENPLSLHTHTRSIRHMAGVKEIRRHTLFT